MAEHEHFFKKRKHSGIDESPAKKLKEDVPSDNETKPQTDENGLQNGGDWKRDKVRYIVVTGGVMSGLGKGVTTSSIGAILKAYGYKVTAIKIDPYLNTDAGTMSPFEHGEVFVLDDGGEADLDLGNYERMMDLSLKKANNITTGKIYQKVIEKERRGDYLGKTVQVIPHVTNEIMNWIREVGHTPTDGSQIEPDFCVIELGGTVGDIESMPFIEAIRQFQFKVGQDKLCLVHVSLIPVIGGSQKTKPTQHGVKELRALGITPDIIACRCEVPVEKDVREKIGLHCHVPEECVISIHNVPNLMRVPLLMESQGMSRLITSKFKLAHNPKLSQGMSVLHVWEDLATRQEQATEEVKIAVVGKYTDFEDAYLSVIKSLQHAAVTANRLLSIVWIEASHLEKTHSQIDSTSADENKEAWKKLRSADGILIPGGFGDRGVEGKVLAAGWARRSGVPFLGICLGMQVAVIEFARNVLGWADANSQEFEEDTEHPVLVYMPEISKTQMGGTMRLGARITHLRPDSLGSKIYRGATSVSERHRHRYEVNPDLVEQMEAKGLKFTGKDETGKRMEVIELENHPFYLATQYHPEFLSRPTHPSPPFMFFILASSGQPLNL